MKVKWLISWGTLFSTAFLVFSARVSCITVSDFLVNPPGLEAIPHFNAEIAFDQYGNFVVAWVDRGLDHADRQIYFQRFDSVGSRIGEPILVSDTAITHHNGPDIAMSPSGSFVICWSITTYSGGYYNHDVWVQGFDSSGQSAWFPRQANEDRQVLYHSDYHPSIAMDNQDNIVVVWQTEDPTGRDVYGQRFSAFGEKIGDNFLVSDINASNYELCDWFTQFPDVAFNSEGYFFVCWLSCVQCRPASPITPLARVYNPAGEPITLVFPFFAPCSSWFDYGMDPAVASNSQNNFVVTFGGNDTLWTYPYNALFVQTFDTLGAPVDSLKIVNDVIDLVQIWFKPAIAVDDSDGYVVLWSDWRQVTSRNLWAQKFNSSGEQVGQNFRINLPPGSLSSADGAYDNWMMHGLAIHANTVGFTWVDYRNWPAYNTDVYAKLLDLDAIGFYLLGDVVLDGVVNLADVIYLINYLYRGGPGPLPEWTGDVTSDGVTNIGDVVYLVNYLFRGGPPPF